MADQNLTVTTRVRDLASKPLRGVGAVGAKAGAAITAGFIKAQLALGALKLAARAAFRALKSITTDAIAEGDAFAKMARRTGVAIETLSAFAHVAELSGTSFQTMANALRKMTTNAFDATKDLGAAKDARRILRPIFEGSQPADHPILLSMPETRYLKFFIFEVL